MERIEYRGLQGTHDLCLRVPLPFTFHDYTDIDHAIRYSRFAASFTNIREPKADVDVTPLTQLHNNYLVARRLFHNGGAPVQQRLFEHRGDAPHHRPRRLCF